MKRLSMLLLICVVSFSAIADEQPIMVNVQFLSALIGPTKLNGKPWDGSGLTSTKGLGGLSDMLVPGSGIPAETVISTVNAIASQGASAPDIVGYVTLTGATTHALAPYAGTPLALSDMRTKTQDSYTPRFYVSYYGWPMYKDTRFQIQSR